MVFLGMRKAREGEVDNMTTNMAKCLMLLSRGNEEFGVAANTATAPSRVFECKTCNREFPSFQALGGHRASHKKPRLEANTLIQSPAKPKTHECSICGQEFAIGQALGGHMRRHRATMQENQAPLPLSLFPAQEEEPVLKKTVLSLFPDQKLPVLTRSNSIVLSRSNSKRVLCVDLNLDLNLAPPENDTRERKLIF